MSEQVRAAVLVAPGRYEVQEFPRPALADGAALLRIEMSGICGTDKHTFAGETKQYAGTPAETDTPFPIIQGHENVGVVEATGGAAFAHDGTPLRVGDRVVPAPNRACGRCRPCRRGFPYYLCHRLENYGNSLTCAEPPHLFGGWAQVLYLRPGTAVFRVPEDLPSEIAVLTEIFAVTHSLERAAVVRRPSGFRPGDTVVVVGVGSLGLAHAVKAALMGAGQVIVVDGSEPRRTLAARLASAHAIEAGSTAIEEIRQRTHGEGADVVVNATGFPESFAPALEMVRDGGTVIEVGAFVDMGAGAFNPATLCGRNLTLMGIGGEDLQVYDATLALLDRHRTSIPFAEMVSHRFAVEDAGAAIRTALDPALSSKVVISDDLADPSPGDR